MTEIVSKIKMYNNKYIDIDFIPMLKNRLLTGITFKYGSKVITRDSEPYFDLKSLRRLLNAHTHKMTTAESGDETKLDFLAHVGRGFYFIGTHPVQRAQGRFLNQFDNQTAATSVTVKNRDGVEKITHDALLAQRQTGLHQKSIVLTQSEFVKLLKQAMYGIQKNEQQTSVNEFHAIGRRNINGDTVLYPVVFKRMTNQFKSPEVIFHPADFQIMTILPIVSVGYEHITKVKEKEIDTTKAIKNYFQFLKESNSENEIEIIDLGEI